MVLTDRDDGGKLVPQLGVRVLQANSSAELQRTQGLATAVVCSDGGVAMVGGTLFDTITSGGPFGGEAAMVGRDDRSQRVTKDDLSGRATRSIRGVAEVEKSLLESGGGDVTVGGTLAQKEFHLLYICFSWPFDCRYWGDEGACVTLQRSKNVRKS